MRSCTHLFLNGLLATLCFAALTTHARAQTLLDRDAGAPGSERPYLQWAGLEGPSLQPVQRVGRQCQIGCLVQASSNDTFVPHAVSRSGDIGATVTPASAASEKLQMPCASSR